MQGKEKESTFGLNRINLGARTVNPTIGRFDRMDAMSEKYYRHSPFNYVLNNPINLFDPDGNEPCCGDLLQKATNYIVNKATDVATEMVIASVKSVKNQAREFFDDITVSPFVSVEAKSTTGARVAIGTKKGVEVDVNVLSVQNASIEGEFDINGFTGSANYLGKDGNIITSSGGAASKGLGASFKQETTKNRRQNVSQKTELTAGGTIYGIGNVSGSAETTRTPTSKTQIMKGYVGIGGVFGLSQVFDGEIKAGVKITRKTEN